MLQCLQVLIPLNEITGNQKVTLFTCSLCYTFSTLGVAMTTCHSEVEENLRPLFREQSVS